MKRKVLSIFLEGGSTKMEGMLGKKGYAPLQTLILGDEHHIIFQMLDASYLVINCRKKGNF